MSVCTWSNSVGPTKKPFAVDLELAAVDHGLGAGVDALRRCSTTIRSRASGRDDRAHLRVRVAGPGPTRISRALRARRSTSGSAASPTATATEIAMQR